MMAVRTDAAVRCSWNFGGYVMFIVCFLNICTKSFALLQYSQAELLQVAHTCSPDKNYWDFIPPEIRRSPGSGESIIPPLRRRRLQRYRKQKQGKRGGVRAKLKANPHKPAYSRPMCGQ